MAFGVAAIQGRCHSWLMKPKERPVFGANSRVPAAGWLGLLIGSALVLLLGVALLVLTSEDQVLAIALTIYGVVSTGVSAWHFKTTRRVHASH